MPPSILAVEFTGLSHPGRRTRNEDCLRWDASLGFAAVADGLGGHAAGDVASRVAIDVLWAACSDARPNQATQLMRAALRADQAVRTLAASRQSYAGMGTTLVAAIFEPDRIHVVNVGDSRLYRLRAGTLRCLTTDHSLSEHRLTRALGLADVPRIDHAIHERWADDIYLLCTDGLSGSVPHNALAQWLLSPQPAAALLEASLAAGATDNISLIIATPPVA